MSKMDGLRAMREARYAQAQARGGTSATKPTVARKVAEGSVPKSPTTPPETGPESLCGHRAISGRTCTRERGHAAKSHRYS